MIEPEQIRLGLCCLNEELREEGIFTSRKMIIRTINQEGGLDKLKEKIKQNLKDVVKLIEWNYEHGIKVLRLSSELFPHKSNPKVEDYSFDEFDDLLKNIGIAAKKYGHRLTFHPGQYNVVGTPRKDVYEKTICDLMYHAEVLERIGTEDAVMVVHGGGVYGDKEKTKERWCKQYNELPEKIKKYLVLENCEKCYSIKDCLEISRKINIPVVFDTHHYECYKKLHPNEDIEEPKEYIKDILDTWKRRGIRVKMHISEQGKGRIGHHSDYIEEIPDYILEIPSKYSTNIDVMIEAKRKEKAILKLYKKYPFLMCSSEQKN